jgi:alkaline phosphatase
VDATPAGFLTHAPSRYDYRLILEQLLQSEYDVLIGGDFTRHKRAGRRADYLELVGNLGASAPERWTIVTDRTGLESASAPMIGLFPPRDGLAYAHGPSLATLAMTALSLLETSPGGFLLALESEEPDEGAHSNSLDRALDGVRELDAAVAEVLEFASRRRDTLVLITADHDTGIPTIVDGTFDSASAEIRWVSDDHTATWVPLFAFGPGADRFAGVYDNTEIRHRIAGLLGFDAPPRSPAERDSG